MRPYNPATIPRSSIIAVILIAPTSGKRGSFDKHHHEERHRNQRPFPAEDQIFLLSISQMRILPLFSLLDEALLTMFSGLSLSC